MTHSPLSTAPVFWLGPVPITDPVIVTWAIMALLVLFAAAVAHRLSLLPSKSQVTLEMLVTAVDSQIRDTMQAEPGPYRALIGTIFIFILTANYSSLIPGVEPPTATSRPTLHSPSSFSARPCSLGFARVGSAAISGPSPIRYGS